MERRLKSNVPYAWEGADVYFDYNNLQVIIMKANF